MSDRLEDPTPKRRRRARKKGDLRASAFAAHSIAFLVSIVPLATIRMLIDRSPT